MFVKELSVLQIRDIYLNHMINDFAAAELKPLDIILKLVDRGIYSCYGLFGDNSDVLAYAMFFGRTNGERMLLDYFAVIRNNRGRGIGGEFLSLLKKKFADKTSLIIEVENPDYAEDGMQESVMQRRILFYQRHGAIMTDITCRLFGVELSIMFLPLSTEDTEEQVGIVLDNLYHLMLPRTLYEQNVLLRK